MALRPPSSHPNHRAETSTSQTLRFPRLIPQTRIRISITPLNVMSNHNIPHWHHLLLHTPLPRPFIVLGRLGAKPSLLSPFLTFLDDGIFLIGSLGRARKSLALVCAADARVFFVGEPEGALVLPGPTSAAAGAEGVGEAGTDEWAECGDTGADNADAAFDIDPNAEVDDRVCWYTRREYFRYERNVREYAYR